MSALEALPATPARASVRRVLAADRSARRARALRAGAALAVAVFAAFAVTVSVGDFPIPLIDVVPAMLGFGDDGAVFVAQELRLPRALTGLFVGAAFGLSGAIFQSVARNALASPDVLGVMYGSALAAVFAIVVLEVTFLVTSVAAFLGGLVLTALIYVLAYRNGVSSYRFVLVGIGLGAVASALTSYLVTQAQLYEAAEAMVWLTGSLNAAGWETVVPLAVALALLIPAGLRAGARSRRCSWATTPRTAWGARGARAAPAAAGRRRARGRRDRRGGAGRVRGAARAPDRAPARERAADAPPFGAHRRADRAGGGPARAAAVRAHGDPGRHLHRHLRRAVPPLAAGAREPRGAGRMTEPNGRHPTLAAEHLRLAYEQREVVSDLSLAIPPGRVTAIVGANACGKSTLLRGLARLLKPRGGAVHLDGADIHSLSTKDVATRMAILPQSPSAPEGITVADLVGRGRYPHQTWLRQWGERDEIAVAAAMEATELVDLAGRPVDELSGGQRQRVWIAMALAQDSPIMLLDEPTTFLDLAHQVEILDLLTDLNQRDGRTIVLVLHDLNHACRYSHHLVAMRDGAIVAEGRPADVVTAELVQHVFGLRCQVVPDPVSQTPMVIPIGRHLDVARTQGAA